MSALAITRSLRWPRRVGGVKDVYQKLNRHLTTVAATEIDWGCNWCAKHQVVYKETV